MANQDLLEYLTKVEETLNRLHNREVHIAHRGGRDRDIEDLTERVAHELGKRLKREGLI